MCFGLYQVSVDDIKHAEVLFGAISVTQAAHDQQEDKVHSQFSEGVPNHHLDPSPQGQHLELLVCQGRHETHGLPRGVWLWVEGGGRERGRERERGGAGGDRDEKVSKR